MSGVQSAKDGNRNNDQHQHYINTQAPKQNMSSKRKTLPAEMRPALGRNHLIRLEHGQNCARIFQRELFRIRRRSSAFTMSRGSNVV